MLLQAVTVHLSPLLRGVTLTLARFWDRRCTFNRAITRKSTQSDLNNSYLGIEFAIEERYAQLYSAIFVIFVYSAGMPLLMLALAVTVVLMYWVDKYLFLRHYNTPPQWSASLPRHFSSLLPYALLLRLGFGIWMLSAPGALPQVTSLVGMIRRLSTYSTGSDEALERVKAGFTDPDGLGVGDRLTTYHVIPLSCMLALLVAGMLFNRALLLSVLRLFAKLRCCSVACVKRCLRPRAVEAPRGLPNYFSAIPTDIAEEVAKGKRHVKPEVIARVAAFVQSRPKSTGASSVVGGSRSSASAAEDTQLIAQLERSRATLAALQQLRGEVTDAAARWAAELELARVQARPIITARSGSQRASAVASVTAEEAAAVTVLSSESVNSALPSASGNGATASSGETASSTSPASPAPVISAQTLARLRRALLASVSSDVPQLTELFSSSASDAALGGASLDDDDANDSHHQLLQPTDLHDVRLLRDRLLLALTLPAYDDCDVTATQADGDAHVQWINQLLETAMAYAQRRVLEVEAKIALALHASAPASDESTTLAVNPISAAAPPPPPLHHSQSFLRRKLASSRLGTRLFSSRSNPLFASGPNSNSASADAKGDEAGAIASGSSVSSRRSAGRSTASDPEAASASAATPTSTDGSDTVHPVAAPPSGRTSAAPAAAPPSGSRVGEGKNVNKKGGRQLLRYITGQWTYDLNDYRLYMVRFGLEAAVADNLKRRLAVVAIASDSATTSGSTAKGTSAAAAATSQRRLSTPPVPRGPPAAAETEAAKAAALAAPTEVV